MATLCFSLAGEGRGHATRIRSVVEQLCLRHKIVIFAGDEAFEFLRKDTAFAQASIELIRIESPRFHYFRGRVSAVRTACGALRYALQQLPSQVARLTGELRRISPDLVIYDFEPSLPRAAARLGVPAVSFDHQHFLLASDFRGLPWKLQLQARLAAVVTRAYDCRPQAIVVSSFCEMPLRRSYSHAIQVGPLLRQSVRNLVPTDEGFVLAYLRRQAPGATLDILARCGRPVHVYGLGERPELGQLQFHDLQEESFTRRLGTCHAVIASAGNQLLGESIHLGKPFLAIPESGLYEQTINAQLLDRMGVGAWCPLEQLRETVVRLFLSRNADFRTRLEAWCGRHDGTEAAVRAIESQLPLGGETFPAGIEGTGLTAAST